MAKQHLKLLKNALLLGLGWGVAFGLAEGTYIIFYRPDPEILIRRLEALVYVLVMYGALVAVGFMLLALVLMGVMWLLRRPLTADKLPVWLPTIAAACLAVPRYIIPRVSDLTSSAGVSASAVVGLIAGLLLAVGVMLGVMLLVCAGKHWLGNVSWLRRWSPTMVLVTYGVLVVALLGLMANYHVLWRLSSGPRSRAAYAASEKPNIVLLTIDALRADSLGVYGYKEKDISPHIDALAAKGVLFEQAIVQAPWTYPSFASMMTSHYPTELDLAGDEFTSNWVDERWVTLAEALHDAGYTTQAILTNPWLSSRFGLAQGFDGYARVDLSLDWDMMLLRQSWGRLPLVGTMLRVSKWWGLGAVGRGWLTDATTVNYHVLRWLHRNRQEPFFLWVHYFDPHAPYEPPPHLMPRDLGVSPERLSFLRRGRLQIGNTRLQPAEVEALRALYDAEIRCVDEGIGAVMEKLETLGLSERTVVVLTADHGEEFMEHGGFFHGFTLYDEQLRVPLIMAGEPLGKVRPVVKSQVSLIDLMPTLLEIAGADAPPGMRGQSLLGLMRSTDDEPPARPAFSEGLIRRPDCHSIRHQGFKVIHHLYQDKLEVYDLSADPGEQADLAAQSPAVEPLIAALNAWEEEVAAVAEKRRAEGRVMRSMDQSAGWQQRLRAGGY